MAGLSNGHRNWQVIFFSLYTGRAAAFLEVSPWADLPRVQTQLQGGSDIEQSRTLKQQVANEKGLGLTAACTTA